MIEHYNPSQEFKQCLNEGLPLSSHKFSIRLIELKMPFMGQDDRARAYKTLIELRRKKK